MIKTGKRILLIACICAAAVVAVICLKLWRDSTVKVSVVSVGSLSGGYWGDPFNTSGLVYDTNNQSVSPAPTQIIHEVFVTQGQEVKAGDKLLSYDMTSEQLTLQAKQIALEQADQAIKDAYAELYDLRNTTPVPEVKPQPEPEAPKPPADPGPEPAKHDENKVWNVMDSSSTDVFTVRDSSDTDDSGNPVGNPGSLTNPRVYKIAADNYLIYGSFYNELRRKTGENDLYFRVDAIVSGGAAEKGKILNVRFLVEQDDNRKWNIRGEMEPPAVSDDQTETPQFQQSEAVQPEYEDRPGMTAEELASRIREIEKNLPRLDLAKRKAALELKIQENEMVDGIVYAKADGVVKTVGDPASPPRDGSAFLVVAAGAGTTIQGTVNEFMLDKVTPGQTVTCTSWDTGTSYTAVIKSIDTYPTENGSAYYGSNPNVSSYNFYAAIDGEADLASGSSLELSFDQSGESENTLTISKAYVRNDAGGYYVMKRGDDGRLTRQSVTVGKIYFGQMIEIRDGISVRDYIAFPYGDGSKEGAATQETEEVNW